MRYLLLAVLVTGCGQTPELASLPVGPTGPSIVIINEESTPVECGTQIVVCKGKRHVHHHH